WYAARMKPKAGRTLAKPEARAAPRAEAASRAVERIVLTLPRGLLENINQLAEKRGLTRSAYIRMVLTDHLGGDSIEDIDRQLYELSKRAERAQPKGLVMLPKKPGDLPTNED
ncbi:MAG: hypothetical protein ACREME_02045, partial [Gemmatimonadales bacterium]